MDEERREELRAKVQKGVKLLDEVCPDWGETVQSVNSDLRMNDCRNCMLGHLYGNYWIGSYRLLVHLYPGRYEYIEPRAVAFGDSFPDYVTDPIARSAMDDHGFHSSSDEDFPILKELWLEEIHSRMDRMEQDIELGENGA